MWAICFVVSRHSTAPGDSLPWGKKGGGFLRQGHQLIQGGEKKFLSHRAEEYFKGWTTLNIQPSVGDNRQPSVPRQILDLP